MWRNGELALDWQLENGEIVGPAAWAGAPLRRGFIQWAEEGFEPDLAEARILIEALAGLINAAAPSLGGHHVAPMRDGLAKLQQEFRDRSTIPDPPGQGPGEA